MKLGKKEPFSHWDWGQYSAPKTQSENHWRYWKLQKVLVYYLLKH